MSLTRFTGIYTDLYQLTMAQVYFLKGRASEQAVFDYLFRKLPFKGGYVVFSGLEDLLKIIEGLIFNEDDLQHLKEIGFNNEFLEYLRTFRFRGNIYAAQEGDCIFPVEPVLQVQGNLIEVQVIETLLLNLLNFQSLVATKARRIRSVAGNKILVDFGLRRAHGPASYYASRAAVIGGFDATSHVKAGHDFDIPVSGTMAHSFVQSYSSELEAFRAYAEVEKEDCVLLVDTYDTLESGLPNAIKVGKELASDGHQLKGIRLDSGDLAYLAKESRKMLDNAGLNDTKIAVSNQLDEYVIRSLLEQKAPIDIFGVGTSLVTGQPDAALDGVYKLVAINDRPSIKVSENLKKTTLPHKKQVYRLVEKDGSFSGADVIAIHGEPEPSVMHHAFDPYKSMSTKDNEKIPMLQLVMENGERFDPPRSLKEIATYCTHQMSKLPLAYQRFENPHLYKVGISENLRDERNDLIEIHGG